MPSEPCARLEFCSIDRSCGDSLPGGEAAYKACGDGDTCDAIVACVADGFAAQLTTPDESDLAFGVQSCGHVANYRGDLPNSVVLKEACSAGFAKLEQAIAASPEPKVHLHCRELREGAKMSGDFQARYQKLCE